MYPTSRFKLLNSCFGDENELITDANRPQVGNELNSAKSLFYIRKIIENRKSETS